MSDLNEQEQLDLVKSKVRELWIYVVAGIAIGLGGLAGWNWYQERREVQAQTAAVRYEDLVQAFGRNDSTRGLALLEELKADYAWTPYPALGELIAARIHVEANELDKAAAGLKSVMDTAHDDELKMIARLRLARVLSAQAKHDEALALLKIEDAGEFGSRLADVRGDVLLAKGDRAGALKEYLAARQDENEGQIDNDLLDLKIRDLGGTPPESTEAS